jgi:hypothetical protein
VTSNDSCPRQQSGYIKDARGRKVTQVDPVALHLLHRADERIPPEVLRELTRKIGIGKLSSSRLAFGSGIVAFACALLLLGSAIVQLATGRMALGGFVWRALLYQGVWVVPLVFWRAARRSRFHRIRQIMLDHLRCPHCGYDLRGLPVSPDDGATVCPECGCAWELGDKGSGNDRGR